jgi:hypothetical protein
MKKKTKLRLNCGEILIVEKEFNVADHWKAVDDMPNDTRLHYVSSPFHFMIVLKHMELPELVKERFLYHYTASAAEKARDVALLGIVGSNYSKEISIINAAVEFHQALLDGTYADHPDRLENDMLPFALSFAKIAHSFDVQAIERMLRIVKVRGLPPGVRGGEDSKSREMFERFEELHVYTRSLPTKMELRKACGLADLADAKVASVRMKKLGLAGLPTKSDLTPTRK